MHIALGQATSWQTMYSDPRDLARVQTEINQHAHPRPVDWPALLAARAREPAGYELSYIEHGVYLASALERLCGGAVASTDWVDFLPMRFDQRSIDLSTPQRSWRLYSVKRMLGISYNFSDEEMEYVQQNERYAQGDRSDDAVRGFCMQALMRIIHVCDRDGVPGSVRYE